MNLILQNVPKKKEKKLLIRFRNIKNREAGCKMECLVILKFRMKIILHGRLFLRREKNAKLLSCRNCLIRDILMEEFISVV